MMGLIMGLPQKCVVEERRGTSMSLVRRILLCKVITNMTRERGDAGIREHERGEGNVGG